MTDYEIKTKLEQVESKHHELSKLLEERHATIQKDLEDLKKRPVKNRDLWDKLGTLTPLISGVLISGIGIYFTHSNNETQHKIQEVQTIEKLIPHLTGDDAEKKMAIIAISTLTNPETAAKIAQMFPSKGTVQALKSIADQGDKKEREVAKRALATSFKTLGEGMEAHADKGAEAQQYYQKALDVQEDVYGANSTKLVDTLVKLGRLSEKQGKFEEAISFYNRARQTMIHNHMSKTRDFQNILDTLSRLYKQTGKMSLANDFSQKAAALGKDLDSGKAVDKDSIISPAPAPSTDVDHDTSEDSPDDFQPIQASGGGGDSNQEPVKVVNPIQDAASTTQLFPSEKNRDANSMDSPFSN
ncbi:MAG: tetratricopeptide repeat protein [Cyanobacteria bacterium HKST-UBA01]|nr:tetratricopeptide repeat protein [Cyanobacteria bacterium HKST-UBA01]